MKTTTFKLNNIERYAIVVALGNLDIMLSSADPDIASIVGGVRNLLRTRGVSVHDIKHLMVKLGVNETAVYSAGEGLR